MTVKRKLLVALAAFLIVVMVLFVFRNFFIKTLLILAIRPSKGYDETAMPPAPDYSRTESWAALPGRDDNADVVPAGDFSDNQADAPVDVFFIHPTTYYSRKGWNQPLDHKRANKITDNDVLRGQVSAFNSCGRIYAPRYRQATLYSFVDTKGNGSKALDIAYEDVKRAFEYYLEHYNNGRPIILASHSQGSRHGTRLLRDYFSGKPLREKLVAAYLIGWAETGLGVDGAFPDIPVCEAPEQTGCWMTWNTMGPKADRSRISTSAVCVNPLTWRNDDAFAARELNLGGVAFPKKENESPSPDVGVVGARCSGGVLLISRPAAKGYSFMPMGRDNYHIYDYSLFYTNIRKNAEDRVAAYFSEPVRQSPTE